MEQVVVADALSAPASGDSRLSANFFTSHESPYCYRRWYRFPQTGYNSVRSTTFVGQELEQVLVYTALAERPAMHKFNYRTPRYAVDFPVQLALDETVIVGRCKEISTDGMQLELRRPLPPGFMGAVCLSWQNIHLELAVRLAHTGGKQDALRFIFTSEKERAAVAELVTRLSDPTEPANQPGLILVR